MKHNYILDSSIAADIALFRSSRGALLLQGFMGPEVTFHAPSHIDVEVVAVIRKFLLLKQISQVHAFAVLDQHLSSPITRHDPAFLFKRVLSLRDNFSAYDASYVALAEAIDGVLVTRDAPLARAATRHCEVVLM